MVYKNYNWIDLKMVNGIKMDICGKKLHNFVYLFQSAQGYFKTMFLTTKCDKNI